MERVSLTHEPRTSHIPTLGEARKLPYTKAHLAANGWTWEYKFQRVPILHNKQQDVLLKEQSLNMLTTAWC